MTDSKGYTGLADAPHDDDEAHADVAPPPPPRRRRVPLGRRLRWPLLIGGPVVVAAVVLAVYLAGGRYITTDDAYVQAARVDISANTSGRVVELDVRQNQRVAVGQQLFRLDSRPFDTAAEEAEAQLDTARAGIQAGQGTVGQRKAELVSAQTGLDFQVKQLARQKVLTGSGVGSQAQLELQAHNVDAARAQLEASKQALATAIASLGGGANGAPSAYPAVRQAQAALDRAKLNQSYTVVKAPQAGVVTRVDQLQVGDYINAAQPLFSLIADHTWIDANFKEDQLAHMRVGQKATFTLSAYPGVTLHGHVESFSPGAGSVFALLPAENATGNWVKVVQRLPVRLAIDDAPKDIALHAGLSVKVSVDTERKRTLFGLR